jgi:hypothetical protein
VENKKDVIFLYIIAVAFCFLKCPTKVRIILFFKENWLEF